MLGIDELEGGIANLSQSPAGTIGTPNAPVGIFRASYKTVAPRTLQLGSQQVVQAAVPTYPPTDWGGSFNGAWSCGFITEDGTPDSFQQKAACQLKYGLGPVAETVIFDWRPGAYNLPPCQYVECAVILWGIGWSASVLRSTLFKAATAPGQMEGAHVPTVTGAFSPDHNGLEIDAPRRAAAVDVYPVSQNGTVVGLEGVTTSEIAFSPTIYRTTDDPSANAPGWTPVECPAGSRFTLLSGNDVYLVRFFLQL